MRFFLNNGFQDYHCWGSHKQASAGNFQILGILMFSPDFLFLTSRTYQGLPVIRFQVLQMLLFQVNQSTDHIGNLLHLN